MTRKTTRIIINVVIWVPLIVLLIIGHLLTPPIPNSGFGGTFGWLSAGLYSAGVVSTGLFSIGVYSAGLFSIGIFSAGLFSIGVFSLGTFVIGVWAAGQFGHGIFTEQAKELGSKK